MVHWLSVSGALPMMGDRTYVHDALFYEINLDRNVPANHLLRCQWTGSLICPACTLKTFYGELSHPQTILVHDPDCWWAITSASVRNEEVHLNLANHLCCRLRL